MCVSVWVCVCSLTQTLQYVSILIYVHTFCLYQKVLDVRCHTSPSWSMLVCVWTYQCGLCSVTQGLMRVAAGWVEGKGIEVEVVKGGLPWMPALCLPWQGCTPPRPSPCPLLEQTKALLPCVSAGSGTYHSNRTGEPKPSHWLNGHTVRRGADWFDLSCTLWSGWNLKDAKKRVEGLLND